MTFVRLPILSECLSSTQAPGEPAFTVQGSSVQMTASHFVEESTLAGLLVRVAPPSISVRFAADTLLLPAGRLQLVASASDASDALTQQTAATTDTQAVFPSSLSESLRQEWPILILTQFADSCVHRPLLACRHTQLTSCCPPAVRFTSTSDGVLYAANGATMSASNDNYAAVQTPFMRPHEVSLVSDRGRPLALSAERGDFVLFEFAGQNSTMLQQLQPTLVSL